MCYLEYLLYIRALFLWDRRALPSVGFFLPIPPSLTPNNPPQYLGPSPAQLVFLFLFIITNSVTLFALSLLLARNIWVLCANITTIEGWEIERHATLVRRAKVFGGYLDGPNGVKVRIVKHEFPYDIGIVRNIQQGLGRNPLAWLWPFALTLGDASGLQFKTNGFEGWCFCCGRGSDD